MEIKLDKKGLIAIFMLVAFIYIVKVAWPILFVVFLSLIFAYMLNPIVVAAQKRNIPRWLSSVALIMFIIFCLSFIVVYMLSVTLSVDTTAFSETMPRLMDRGIAIVASVADALGIDISIAALKAKLANWSKSILSYTISLLGGVATSLQRLSRVALNIVLVPVLTFLILKDYPNYENFLDQYIGYQNTEFRRYLTMLNDVMSRFFRGQIVVALLLSTIYTIALLIIGMRFAVLLGVMTGVLSIIPYLGFTVGIIVTTIVAAIEFQDLLHPFSVIVAYSVISSIESMYITPKVVGSTIGLHPVVSIVALLIGGSLFGILGMLLALPVSAIFYKLYKEKIDKMKNNPAPIIDQIIKKDKTE